jgi:hypothetical protein
MNERDRRSGRVLGLLSPKPLRSYVVDADRPRDELCEELAQDVWRALLHRRPLEVAARRLVGSVRQASTGLRARRNRGPREGGPRS